MKIDTLEKLYVHELKDLHSAETQILDALPTMIDAARDDGLRAALASHRDETAEHAGRIEQIFERLDFEPGGHRCKGISGVLAEAKEILRDVDTDRLVDAAIIAGCQRVEHYEIAGYGVARALARQLGRDEDAELLTKTLEEEGAADRALTRLAEHHLNFAASAS